VALALSGYYVFISYKLFKEKNTIKEKKIATKLFAYSILYLFMIFTFILVDKII
jgi:heme o synthase